LQRLTRQESHAQTRQKLIQAARGEIARKGIAAASVRSISEAAGFSQGAFYSCFESKEALLLHLFKEHLGTILIRLAGVPERIEAQHETTPKGDLIKLVCTEMDAFLASTNPGTTYSSVAVELQLHANHSAKFSRHFEDLRKSFQTELGQIMERICDFLPNPLDISPSHLGMALLSTSVGFSTAGSLLSPDARRHILSAFFRAIASSGSDKRT
jgi:AcrR family transcriptional regulator